MPLSITLPLLGKGGDTRDLVISILSEEWPLTAKEIHNRAKNIGKNVTYQAVHKSVKLLEAARVVRKVGRQYSLEEQWVTDMKELAERIANKYTKEEPKVMQKLRTEGNATITLDSLIDFAYFLLDFHEMVYAAGEVKGPTVIRLRHSWIATVFARKDYERLANMFKQDKMYFAIRADTPMDRWYMSFMEKLGAQARFGVDVASECDTKVMGDTIMNIYHPPKMKEWFDREYKKTPQKVDMQKLYQDLHGMRDKIVIHIYKDKQVAEQMRKETLALFDKK